MRGRRPAGTPEELHGDVRHALALVGLVHRDDVVVVDPGRGLCLAEEPRAPFRVGGELGPHHFQREAAVQARVQRQEDGAHIAPAQFLHDAVGAERSHFACRCGRAELEGEYCGGEAPTERTARGNQQAPQARVDDLWRLVRVGHGRYRGFGPNLKAHSARRDVGDYLLMFSGPFGNV